MINTKYKRGYSLVAIPFLLVISILMIIIIGSNIINSIIPFIYHQKLITISNKYMFVIEKFGYLTDEEKNLLITELNDSGFDTSKIALKYPNELKKYGELIEFEIDYILVLETPAISGGTYGTIEKETILKVKKNSFSKI
jgi:lipopolysaccharide/colanic/teichoic acid biosynthesis glycosyltransferase